MLADAFESPVLPVPEMLPPLLESVDDPLRRELFIDSAVTGRAVSAVERVAVADVFGPWLRDQDAVALLDRYAAVVRLPAVTAQLEFGAVLQVLLQLLRLLGHDRSHSA